ncbi:MAG: hypothetical protein HUJ56_12410, partial [Erysipelotrichaceae bacterium]|nr:hypothetical protein [Erysipelotrichaceae bacterium]
GRWLVGITKEYKNEPLPLMGNEKAYIEDNAGILDAKVFEDGFDAFMENTGIIPSVISVNNEDWQPYYNNLESYALELYLKHFDDEQHFLIVYSEPKEVDPKFNDWYWEAIQGDDTINIITEDTFASFQNDMMTYLVREEYTTSEAIAKCFENGAIVMKQDGKINDDGRFIMIYGVGFLIAGGGLLCFFLKKYYDSKCLYEAEIV